MKVAIFYFSATGVTHQIAQEIQNNLQIQDSNDPIIVNMFNILYPSVQAKSVIFSDYDVCFFGFPVYAGRLPRIAEEWFLKQKGESCPCAMFFTYGGRLLENANQVTYHLLTRANFRPILSAEFLGRHSFNVAKGWKLCEDRPNAEDFHIAREFSQKAIELIRNPEVHFQINMDDFHYTPAVLSTSTQRSAFHPSRFGEGCSMCRQCEIECPVNAMNADTGEVHLATCLQCMHCVSICPDHVLKIDDVTEKFPNFMNRWHLTSEIVAKKQSLFYSSYPEKKNVVSKRKSASK